MAYGKTIELFLVNGTADSIITAELSNWNGKAIKIPRIEVQSCNREDVTQAGVYFLFCKEDDESDSVYIGESENVNGKRKDARKTVEVINKERAKGGKIIYVNFLDRAGWIGRQADLKAEPNLEVVYAKGQVHFSSFPCC